MVKNRTDPVANVTLLGAKAAELVGTNEGRLLLGIVLAKAGTTPAKLDEYARTMRGAMQSPAKGGAL